MNYRERQLTNNLNTIFGMYENGISDYGIEEYPLMTEEEAVAYAISQIYDMQDDGRGRTHYAAGICKDLRFLGNTYIKMRILEIAAECGVLK